MQPKQIGQLWRRVTTVSSPQLWQPSTQSSGFGSTCCLVRGIKQWMTLAREISTLPLGSCITTLQESEIHVPLMTI